jgi:2-polyprenyl-3-methyl-5-hydroxy-6-metoxy-1,4-benzoquinol methylase
MSFLRLRRSEPEIMDDPHLDAHEHARALSVLARLNSLSGGSSVLFRAIASLHRRLGTDRLKILDVASGAGDLPVRLWRRAARAGLDWRIAGCDVSGVAVEQARARALASDAPVHFFVHDALTGPLPGPYDVVTCSLFLHHLSVEQGTTLLQAMSNAGSAWPALVLIDDLDRSLRGYVLTYLATRLLTRSRVVRTDGLRSARAAFTPAEALALAEAAGMHGSVVARRWPCRWLLSWSRPA